MSTINPLVYSLKEWSENPRSINPASLVYIRAGTEEKRPVSQVISVDTAKLVEEVKIDCVYSTFDIEKDAGKKRLSEGHVRLKLEYHDYYRVNYVEEKDVNRIGEIVLPTEILIQMTVKGLVESGHQLSPIEVKQLLLAIVSGSEKPASDEGESND